MQPVPANEKYFFQRERETRWNWSGQSSQKPGSPPSFYCNCLFLIFLQRQGDGITPISFYLFLARAPLPLLNLTVFKSPCLSLWTAKSLRKTPSYATAFPICRKMRDRSPARGLLGGKTPSAERRAQPRIPPVRLIVRAAWQRPTTALTPPLYPAFIRTQGNQSRKAKYVLLT